MKQRDANDIEDALDEIETEISDDEIPAGDRPSLDKARALVKRLRSNKRKKLCFFGVYEK